MLISNLALCLRPERHPYRSTQRLRVWSSEALAALGRTEAASTVPAGNKHCDPQLLCTPSFGDSRQTRAGRGPAVNLNRSSWYSAAFKAGRGMRIATTNK